MTDKQGQDTAGDRIAEAAEFLCKRLEEFERELEDDDVGREYYGHVHPAFARLVLELGTNHGCKSDLYPGNVPTGGDE